MYSWSLLTLCIRFNSRQMLSTACFVFGSSSNTCTYQVLMFIWPKTDAKCSMSVKYLIQCPKTRKFVPNSVKLRRNNTSHAFVFEFIYLFLSLSLSPKYRPGSCHTTVWLVIKNSAIKFHWERTNALDLQASSINHQRLTMTQWPSSIATNKACQRANNRSMNSSRNHVIEWVSSIDPIQINLSHHLMRIHTPKMAAIQIRQCYISNVLIHLIWMIWLFARVNRIIRT